jgi:hypothetical protein
MFVYDRSAFAVLLPLALLAAVAFWFNRGSAPGEAGTTQPLVAQQTHEARPAAN